MYLPVLDQSPRNAAEYTADVHLSNSIFFCSALLNTALHVMHSDVIIAGKDVKGDPFYLLDDVVLTAPTPPTPVMSEWVGWVRQGKRRAWWVVLFAYFLNRERTDRYPGLEPHPAWRRVDYLNKAKATRFFDPEGRELDEFPFILPTKLFPKFVYPAGFDAIQAYRESYRLLIGKQRLKWSKHGMPSFMGGQYKGTDPVQWALPLTTKKMACDQCSSDADPRMCDIANCPGKKAYNL